MSSVLRNAKAVPEFMAVEIKQHAPGSSTLICQPKSSMESPSCKVVWSSRMLPPKGSTNFSAATAA